MRNFVIVWHDKMKMVAVGADKLNLCNFKHENCAINNPFTSAWAYINMNLKNFYSIN